MSIKLYTFRIPKEGMWETLEQIRAFYQRESILGKLVDAISVDGSYEQRYERLMAWNEKAQKLKARDDLSCELQLFDEGDSWLLRPLEMGYLFLNSYEREDWAVEPVFYNNSTDVPEEQRANSAVAEWVDQQIDAGRYLIYNLISVDDADWRVMTRLAEAAAKPPAPEKPSAVDQPCLILAAQLGEQEQEISLRQLMQQCEPYAHDGLEAAQEALAKGSVGWGGWPEGLRVSDAQALTRAIAEAKR